MLTDEQINKFQLLYLTRFGKEITRKEAHEQGIKLVRLMELVYKPITKTDLDNLNN